ncbi:MAG: hypothetical protein ACRDQY_10635 [Pseudonocardiaceae bacterium]
MSLYDCLDYSHVGIFKPSRYHEQFESSTLHGPFNSGCPGCQLARSTVLNYQVGEPYARQKIPSKMPPKFDDLQRRIRPKQAEELLDERAIHLNQERGVSVHLSNDGDWDLKLGDKRPHVTSGNVCLQRGYLKQ